MKLSLWFATVRAHDASVANAEKALDEAKQARNAFYRETVGSAPGDKASIDGTVTMMVRVNQMQMEEKNESV